MLPNLINEIMKTEKRNFFYKLVRSNSGVSSKNFFLVCTTIVGVFMLVVLVAGFIVDMIFNHTITIDMNGAAIYIGAVASLFASAGLTKAWSDASTNKYLGKHPECYKEPEEEEEEIIPDEE
jgi:hypothetical protein